MKKLILQLISPKLFLVLITTIASININAQNLLTNGNLDGSGGNFSVDNGYTQIISPNGTSTPGKYALTTNPQLFNSTYIPGGDHPTGSGAGAVSGTGKMLVFHGSTTAGAFVWGTGGPGIPASGTANPIGNFVVGETYTFSYWIKSVSNLVTDKNSRSTISIMMPVGAEYVNPAGLTIVAPLPADGWQKVSYSFRATGTNVMIRMQTQNPNTVGNAFALDDFSITKGAMPFDGTLDVVQPTCSNIKDDHIILNLQGGYLPWGNYALTGTTDAGTAVSRTSPNGIFTNLAPGTYSVSGQDSKGSTVTKSDIVLAIPNDLVLGGPTTTCPGQPVALTATGGGGAGTYTWTANPADPTLTNPNAANQTVSPLVRTTYTVTSGTASNTTNLLQGGDMEGVQRFNSFYQWGGEGYAHTQQGSFFLGTNPNTWFNAFIPMGDHTTGSGNMFMADGSTIANTVAWTNVDAFSSTGPATVQQNKDYTFSFYVASIASGSPSELDVLINGVSIGVATAPDTPGTWALKSFTWNSGSNTEATITIIDRNTEPQGNDFALDDMSLTDLVTCGYTKTITVDVATSATPTFTLTQPTCAVQTGAIQITTVLANGTEFKLDNGTPQLGAIFNNIAPGSHTITFPNSVSGCLTPITFVIDPVAAAGSSADLTFSYTTPVCKSATTNPTPITGTTFTTGGTFTALPIGLTIDPTTGAIDLSSSASGTYIVTYTVAPDNTLCLAGGSSTATIVIDTQITPLTTISYSSPVCKNVAINPTPTTAAGFTTGGTYSATPAGLSIDIASGEINLASSTPGAYTVTYTVASNTTSCLTGGSSTANIIINPAITAVTDFSYTTSVCKNATANPTPTPAAGFTTGGTYSATPVGLAINSTTGAIDLSSSASGTYAVTYTVASNTTSCLTGRSSTANITINPAITAVTAFSYTTPVCKNATVNPSPIIAAGFTTGGTYSATPVGLAINSTTGAIDLSSSASGTYAVTYTVASNNAQCLTGGSTTANIVINAGVTPVTTISYSTPVCKNATVNPMPTTATGLTAGGTYSATPAGLSIDAVTGEIDLSSSTAGTYDVTYTVAANSATCLAGASTTTTIVINPAITAETTISYTTPVCIAGSNPLPTTATGFTTGGTYSATPVGLSINAATGEIDLSSSTTGTYTVAYAIASNIASCLIGGSSTTTIVINPETAPTTAISYTASVCLEGANPLPTTATGFTTGGTFAAAAAGLSIDAATGLINLTSTTAGTYAITYTIAPNNVACLTGGSATANIVINPSIVPVTAISYATPVCPGSTNPIPTTSTGFTAGGTYSATPAGLSIDPATGEIDLSSSTSGTYTVAYTVAADPLTCQILSSSTSQIVISAPIEVAVSGDCDGNNFVLNAAPINNSFDPSTVSYSWIGSQGNDAGHTQSTIVTKPDTYTVQITSGLCSSKADLTVDSISCTIQKGISPNNDTKNDVFKLNSLNVKHLSIFNRYGQKVYSLSNYTDQCGGQSDNGDELPDGTYYYVIDRNNGEATTGWIYINRAQ